MPADDQSDNEHGEKQLGMGYRGVSRPMPLMHAQQTTTGHSHGQSEDGDDQGDDHDHGDGAGSDDGGGHEHGHHMTEQQRMEMLTMHHHHTLWIYWSLLILGVWQLLAPFTFGYLNPENWVHPSGGRGVWFSDQTHDYLRAWLITGSDLLSGVLLLIFGWRSLKPNRPISLWICCFVGIGITFAPVLFWAPTPAAYLNDTIVGMLLICLTILIPGMPNMIRFMQMGGDQPAGWTYNPSSWAQRWIMIATGFAGFVVSRYLAAFQLGYIDRIWEPFFGRGTELVLNSDMSHMWPISDGGLGALSYTFEFLMGFMGAPSRWRTMPWMVTFFGILVIPLGLTHILLVISQPVIVGHWCTLCLLAASIMLPMLPLEVDEVIAMGQHMVLAKRRGDRGGSLWTIFWKGGEAGDATHDQRSPKLAVMPDHPWKVFIASIWGMSFPWTLCVSAALGIYLMAGPGIFGSTQPASAITHLGGALVVTVSVISMGEVVRIGRYLNVLLGLIIAIGPWVLSGANAPAQISATLAGVAIIALAIPRGRITERYGLWDRFVR